MYGMKNSQYVAQHRARIKEQGFKAKTIWILPDEMDLFDEFVSTLTRPQMVVENERDNP